MTYRLLALASLVLFLSSALAQDGLTVIWGEDRADHGTLDPRVTQSRHEEQFIAQVFEPLIAADAEGNFHPGLAESWEVSEDGLCWTFSLTSRRYLSRWYTSKC